MTGPAGTDALAAVRRVADTVLYEGYVLFPYRASATKNRYRWQFGVLIPRAQADAGTPEPSELRSQCLLRPGPAARVSVTARFLRVRRRAVEQVADGGFRPVAEIEVGGQLVTAWDEGVEQEVAVGPARLAALADTPLEERFDLPGDVDVAELSDDAGTRGRTVRSTEPVAGSVRLSARPVDADVVRLETTVRNMTRWAAPEAPRDEVVLRCLVGVHLLVRADDAVFASVTDPPDWAARWVGDLDNRHTHPVLASAGHDVVLSCPIILPDHPQVAAESAGDSYDATEIDELLTLAVQSLTDEEKRRARATDPRAAAVVDRAAGLPPEVMDRLHGAIRQFEPAPLRVADDHEHRAAEVDAELDQFFGVGEAPTKEVDVGGRTLRVGDRVRLAPRRRADAQDLFAVGRTARVERIETDLEGRVHLAVTLPDDPGADLHAWSRRFLYFQPDEVELLDG